MEKRERALLVFAECTVKWAREQGCLTAALALEDQPAMRDSWRGNHRHFSATNEHHERKNINELSPFEDDATCKSKITAMKSS